MLPVFLLCLCFLTGSGSFVAVTMAVIGESFLRGVVKTGADVGGAGCWLLLLLVPPRKRKWPSDPGVALDFREANSLGVAITR